MGFLDAPTSSGGASSSGTPPTILGIQEQGIDLGGNPLTNVADGAAPQDAVNKEQLDGVSPIALGDPQIASIGIGDLSAIGEGDVLMYSAAEGLIPGQLPSGGGGQVTVTKTVAPSGGDYTNLQDAIAAATDGWEIKLLPGTYSLTANLTISQANITVRGSGASSIIDTGAYLLDSTGAHFTLEGVKVITSSVNDVMLNFHGDYWLVRDCWFDGRSATSCFVAFGHYGIMSNNSIQIYGHYQGFNYNSSQYSVFSNNTVTIDEVANNGIAGFNSSNILVSGNQFIVTSGASQFHRYPIGLSGNYITFTNNQYVAADVNGGGIQVDGQNCVVTGNILTNIDLGNTFGIIGYGIKFVNSNGLGIVANNVIPSGNIIVDNASVTVRNNITVDDSGDNTPAVGGSSVPRANIAASFDTISRYYTVGNNYSATLTPTGIQYDGTTLNYSVVVAEQGGIAVPIFDRNPTITWRVEIGYSGSYSSDQYYVLGYNNGGSYAWGNGAGNYMGFHVNNSFGTFTVSGITGDGSTQNSVTLSPTTGIAGYAPIMTAVMTSATKVDFYIDGYFLGTSTTNLPTGTPGNGLWNATYYSTTQPNSHMTLQHLSIDYDVAV
jgi:hypothetical protein